MKRPDEHLSEAELNARYDRGDPLAVEEAAERFLLQAERLLVDYFENAKGRPPETPEELEAFLAERDDRQR